MAPPTITTEATPIIIPTSVRMDRNLCDQIESTAMVAASQKAARERWRDAFIAGEASPAVSLISEKTVLMKMKTRTVSLGVSSPQRRADRGRRQQISQPIVTHISISYEYLP